MVVEETAVCSWEAAEVSIHTGIVGSAIKCDEISLKDDDGKWVGGRVLERLKQGISAFVGDSKQTYRQWASQRHERRRDR